ncbi:hypothetical protein N7470_003483 [Penicillium chermesinum]|nr:hypothetical protein N7470_003483 [Penicillium chermesinum]
MASTRQYDLVVLGPTGYTGRFCAEHIVKNLPTDLKWAIAGRSPHKIEPIAKDLKALNPDRLAPDVLAVSLDPTELAELAQKTRLIINCIGPYILYGTPVVEACAKNGTHYVDVKRLDHHPLLGFESVPADMLAWSLVKRVREDLSSQTRSIESCIKKIKSAGASGGTLNSIFSNFEALPVSQLFKGFQPFSLAVSTPPKDVPGESILEKLLGVRYVRDLGTLTTSPNGMADMAIVHRSSSLMSELYGKRFYFRQLLYVRSYFLGVLFHVGFNLFMASLLIPPVRWLLRRVVYAPGAGPSLESTRNDYAELNAVATADQNTPNPKRVFGKWYFQGSQYVLTGLLVAEAAMVILNEEDKVRKVSRGGIVTSATLGQAYVDRLDKVGVHIETKVLED